MGTLLKLSVLALRQVASGACETVGGGLGGQAAGKVVDFLADRFTNHGARLTAALQKANERAWKAMEVALAGESLWERCKTALASAEDYLQAVSLT